MMNNNWQKNLQVIAKGGGSDQARHCREECPICNDEDEEKTEPNVEE